MSHYDAIVIGGGIAGSAFAYAAAYRGKKILLLEKNMAGSAKVCGGVLSRRCLRAFECLGLKKQLDSLAFQEIQFLEIELFSGHHLKIPFPKTHPSVRVVNRGELDAMLWTAAGKAGATTFDRTVAAKIDFLPTIGWQVVTSGTIQKKYVAPVLIGADGRNSFVGRQLGLVKTQARGSMSQALCFQYKLTKHCFDPDIAHFFIFQNGYCGLSTDGKAETHLDVISLCGGENEDILWKRLLAQKSRFVEKLKEANLSPGRPLSRFPIGSGSRELPNRPDVALLGDAQLWVEPFTGEGISLALESAYKVATMFCNGIGVRCVPPKVSYTNGWVARALEKPFLAKTMIRTLQRLPVLTQWMTADVLG